MLIPCILCKLAKKYGKMKQLKRVIHLSKVNSFIDLFKDMTEPDNFNRIKPDTCLQKYNELDKLYLSKNVGKPEKRTRQTRRTKRR